MDYKHCRCGCGGIIGQYSKTSGFICEKCNKEYQLSELKYDWIALDEKTGWLFPILKKGGREMRKYTINLPRGLEVDIFNLPEDFKEQVEQAFREYTSGTAKAYMYVYKLGFIDRCVEYLNGDNDSDDVVNTLVGEAMIAEWRNNGEIIKEDDIYSFEFMEDCYRKGKEDAKLNSHFGTDDHHIYDQIQKVLVQVIKIVMNYEDKEDAKC